MMLSDGAVVVNLDILAAPWKSLGSDCSGLSLDFGNTQEPPTGMTEMS